MTNLLKRLIVLFLLIPFANLWASVPINTPFDDALRYDNDVIIDDVYNVAEKYIPKDLINVFKEYTNMDDEEETKFFAIQILSIGYWESGWKITKSKPNKDGSYDIGYMMLNTKNIENKRFMQIYGPEEDVSTDLEKYLIVCINFYKELYGRYKYNAIYAYNCGEGRYINRKIPKSTYIYKQRVKECIDKFNIEIKKESEERIRKENFLKTFTKIIPKFIIYNNTLNNKPYNKCNRKITIFYIKNLFILNKEYFDYIYEKISEYGNKENENFVFAGLIKKDNVIRPVFYCKLNGRKYLC